MFTLLKSNGASFSLQEGRTYVVGRRESNIILEDVSVSRKHAKIKINGNKVLIEDLKSSNKTHINGNALKPHVEIEMKIGSEIKFGNKDSIFILQSEPLLITTSGLNGIDKSTLKATINKLSGKIIPNWNLNCTHIVVNELVLTVKVLCALITKQHVVTVNYFNERLKQLNVSGALPNPNDYRPSLPEDKLPRNVQVDFELDRQRIFRNKTFVFLNNSALVKMENVITLAGGKVIDFETNPIPKNRLLSKTTEYLFIITNEDSQSEDTEFNECVAHLKTKNRRSIPVQEIAMAIVTGNCSSDCNPAFNRIGHLVSAERVSIDRTALVPETQSAELNETVANASFVVPASFESTACGGATGKRKDDSMVQGISKKSKLQLHRNKVDELDVGETNCDMNMESKKDEMPKKVLKINNVQSNFACGMLDQPSTSKKRKSDDVPSTPNKKSIIQNPFTSPKSIEVLESFTLKKSANNLNVSSQEESSDSRKKKFVNPFANLNKPNKNLFDFFKTPSKTEKIPEVRPVVEKNIAPVKNVHNETLDNTSCILPMNVLSSTKIEEERNVNKTVSSDLTSLTWLSKSNAGDYPPEIHEDITVEMRNFISIFNTTVIIRDTDSMIVRKPFCNVSVNSITDNGAKNYKKFKKVKPMKAQTTIIPSSTYMKVICCIDGAVEAASDARSQPTQLEQPVLQTPAKKARTTKTGAKFKFDI